MHKAPAIWRKRHKSAAGVFLRSQRLRLPKEFERAKALSNYNRAQRHERVVNYMPIGAPNKRYAPEFKKWGIQTMLEEKLS